MARTPLIAGNWKLNLDHLEATHTVQKLAWLLRDAKHDFTKVEAAVMASFTSLRSVQTLCITHETCIYAQPLERIAHRAEVGAAGIDQCDIVRTLVFHSMPLVLGKSLPSRRNACRNARATTLKQASTLW